MGPDSRDGGCRLIICALLAAYAAGKCEQHYNTLEIKYLKPTETSSTHYTTIQQRIVNRVERNYVN
jgi:hypothetical protein